MFHLEQWLEHPDAPLFTYGLGYRMCAGSILANQELYLVFMRLMSCFEVRKEVVDGIEQSMEIDPVKGVDDPTSLVAAMKRYMVLFVPRDEQKLKRVLEEAEGRVWSKLHEYV